MFNDDVGLWCEIFDTPADPRPALFLDRDGVVIADTHYLGRPEELRMMEGAAAAVARCNRLGIPVVLVTNQSGVARGYYDWNDFQAVQCALATALAAANGRLDAVLACAYHADGREPLRVAGHPWRKPNPGMILAAGQRMNLDLPRSWIVGDKAADLAAGQAAGLAGGILISPRQERAQLAKAQSLANGHFLVETASSLAEAVAALIDHRRLAR